ncbi:hypothetical protein [Herbiconiux daphne]|uniref:Multidrug ABC transporter ATPase n=1 Tax=Herbiconiux daphne TaxID=2970914 RepID=A0ABT2GZJ5_9MICO|nr:hypothetical protein [Herbiconiux daphne]MCS5732732.1 hypothetical protein [Herbiconiux daphne]
MSDTEQTPASRIERSLTFAVVTVLGLSVLAIIAVLIAGAASIDLSGNSLWTTIALLPVIGLPIGFVLMLILLVLSMRRRARDARGSR